MLGDRNLRQNLGSILRFDGFVLRLPYTVADVGNGLSNLRSAVLSIFVIDSGGLCAQVRTSWYTR